MIRLRGYTCSVRSTNRCTKGVFPPVFDRESSKAVHSSDSTRLSSSLRSRKKVFHSSLRGFCSRRIAAYKKKIGLFSLKCY